MMDEMITHCPPSSETPTSPCFNTPHMEQVSIRDLLYIFVLHHLTNTTCYHSPKALSYVLRFINVPPNSYERKPAAVRRAIPCTCSGKQHQGTICAGRTASISHRDRTTNDYTSVFWLPRSKLLH